MAAAYRDSISALTSSSAITVDPAVLTYQAGDVLVLHVWGYATLGAPSGSGLTWDPVLTRTHAHHSGGGVLAAHKVFTAVAAGSVGSFTVANGITDQIGYALTSVSGADPENPVDASGIDSNVFGTVSNPVAPDIDPTYAGSLLICGAGAWTAGGGVSFTPPSGMTEREDFASWDGYAVATVGLTSAGATGTKAFSESPTPGSAAPWLASSIAIKAAVTAGSTILSTDRVPDRTAPQVVGVPYVRTHGERVRTR